MGAVLSSQRDFVFFGENFSRYALEIETGGELFARLINRVVEFLCVYFGNNVEREGISRLCSLDFELRIDQSRKSAIRTDSSAGERSGSNHFASRISSHHFDIAFRDPQLNYSPASAVD